MSRETGFTKGVNVVVMPGERRGEFGYDLGRNQLVPQTNVKEHGPARVELIKREFERLAGWGIEVVRIFAFERGEGLTWNPDRDQVTGLDGVFLANAAQVAELARASGLAIYWCLLDFASFKYKKPGANPKRAEVQNERIVPAMLNILQDRAALDSYYEKAVLPFVAELNRVAPTALYGIDLFNEPEWLWLYQTTSKRPKLTGSALPLSDRHERHLTGKPTLYRYGVSRRVVATVLDRLANRLKQDISDAPPISAGFSHDSQLMQIRRDEELGLKSFDFFDIHQYNHWRWDRPPRYLPAQQVAGDRPCIVGEAGPGGQVANRFLASPTHWLKATARPVAAEEWEDLYRRHADLVEAHFRRAKAQGYRACFLWEHGYNHGRYHADSQQSWGSHPRWGDHTPLLALTEGTHGDRWDRPLVVDAIKRFE